MASRIPSALSAVLLIAIQFTVSRKFVTTNIAINSCLILLSSPLFFAVSHLALTDMIFSSLTSISLLFFFAAQSERSLKYYYTACSALGLALIGKGPLALALVFSTILLFLVVHRTYLRDMRTIRFLRLFCTGSLFVVLIAAPWFVAVHFATHGAFTEQFFVQQNLGRLFRISSFQSHTNPWWYYVPVLLCGMFPWSVVLIGALLGRNSTRIVQPKQKEFLTFCLCWVIASFSLLSFASSKLPTYILPCLPPLTLLTAAAIASLVSARRFATLRCIGLVCGTLTFLVIPFVPRICSAAEQNYEVIAVQILLLLVSLVQILCVLISRRFKRGIFCPLLIGISLCFYLTCLSLIKHQQFANTQQSLLSILKTIPAKAQLATLYGDVPIAYFQLRQHVTSIATPDELEKFLSLHPRENCFLLSGRDIGEALVLKYPLVTKVRNGKWILFRFDQGAKRIELEKAEP